MQLVCISAKLITNRLEKLSFSELSAAFLRNRLLFLDGVFGQRFTSGLQPENKNLGHCEYI